MDEISDDQLHNLYSSYLVFTDQMAAKYSAPALAGVMMAIAMQLYKTILSPEDFEEITDNILSSRDSIQSLSLGKGRTLQ